MVFYARTINIFIVVHKSVRKFWANGKRGLVVYWRTRKCFMVIHEIVRKRRANGKRRRVGVWRRTRQVCIVMIGGGGIVRKG